MTRPPAGHTGRPARRSILLPACLALTLTACGGDGITGPDARAGVVLAGDPRVASAVLTGSLLYVHASSSARRQADEWRESRPADAAQMDRIASQPVAIWLGEWSGDVRAAVADAVGRAGGRMTVFVAYNIPGRDCGGYSAGGVSAGAYPTWVRDIASALGGGPAVVVLEPDALAGLDCLSTSAQAERLALLADAVDVLKTAGAAVYLDGGNARWQSAELMASRLQQAAVDRADGFALNVSNFIATDVTTDYGTAISQRIGGKRFVIDVSRNGLGPSPDGHWCNPDGRALGVNPTTVTGHALVDAYLWVKVPGESDGPCNGGPRAGTWWPEYALGLAQRQPATVSPPPSAPPPPPPPLPAPAPDPVPAPEPEPLPPPEPEPEPSPEPPPVVNQAPIARVGGPYTGKEGSALTLSAAGSVDPEGGSLAYAWDFGDGTTATGEVVSKTYAQSSRYVVTLTVTDSAGATSSTTAAAEIADVAPTAQLVAPLRVLVGRGFTLELNNATDVSAADHAAGYSYQFDCGQGSFTPWSSSSRVSCAPHRSGGRRLVRARVRDQHDHGSREYRATVTIRWSMHGRDGG